MKTVLSIITALWLLIFLTGSAMAIDKTKKDDKAPKDRGAVIDKGRKPAAPDTQKPKSNDSGSRSKRPYDDFIDTNKNGVDDRVERAPQTQKPKQPAPRPKPAEQKPLK